MATPWLTPVRPGAQQNPVKRTPDDEASMVSVTSELLRQLDAAPEAAQRQYRDRLAQLVAMFPDSTKRALDEILESVDSDLERAVAMMYSPLSPYHKKRPATLITTERPPMPDFSYPGNPWLAGTSLGKPPADPLATPAAPQPSLRARALAVVIAAPPTQPDREDTPMEEVVAVPDLVTPAPEDPESEPGSPISPWAPTQEDENARRDTLYLRQMFPTMSDEFVLRALEEGNGDPAATIAWASAITDADRVLSVIADAFPTAAPGEVKDTLLAKNGNAAAAYALLSRQHISAWDQGHSSLHSQLARKLIPTDEGAAPKFQDQDPSYARHETRWWETMVATKAYKVAGSARDSAAWSHVSLLATSTIDVTPRVAGYVESLGAWYTDKSAFQEVMKHLQVFHAFGALTRYCTTNPEQQESALSVILALMEDGLASPGAATWAMQQLTKSTQAYNAGRFYFSAYGANHHTLWNRRNQSLAAWKATRDPPAEDEQAAAEAPPPGGADKSQAAPPRPTRPSPPVEAASATATPKSACPRSLPGASRWALPMSESTSKYVDLTARPKPKRAQSTSASKPGEPQGGRSDPGTARAPRAAALVSRKKTAGMN